MPRGTVFTSIPPSRHAAAANLARDLNFTGTIVGNVYAQPLYIEGGPNGPMIIAVTQSNNVYALNATTGSIIWQRNDSAHLSRQACPAETSIRLALQERRLSILPRVPSS